jgi:uncharacterized membrane protein YedE/YeeE
MASNIICGEPLTRRACPAKRFGYGEVVDVYLQARRDGAAAKRFFRRYRQILFALFHILLLTLIWRLVDFLDELMSGATKMSLGKYMLEGRDALILQSVIIGILWLLVYQMKKWHTSCEPGQ